MKLKDLPGDAMQPDEAIGLQADIEFGRNANGATGIRRQRVGYPFHLGRALQMPGDPAGMPTVYLQSCSGGIFQKDDLRIRIAACAGASAHVTSAASTVVHGMEIAGARQMVKLDAAAGALLEYLPDPLILFPRARLHNAVHLRLDPQATVLLGDALLLHDPRAAQETGHEAFEQFESETVVQDPAGRLLVCDRFRIGGEDLARALPGVNGRYRAQATFFAFSAARPAAVLVEVLRTALSLVPEVYAAASALPNGAGAWVRVLAHDAIGARAALHAAWAAARTELTGQAPAVRRK